ncbi:MAG: hypothetical protein A3J29_07650 [Acidobacteria bacterium RIFCSPLOWO2_12_FULL_67_14b]|nr:MAG: hypothetical protein A3J29_07650 [Acidobacteria bacterium RIFCSPLOWO2_12_FULL_67_14b]
MLWRGAAAQTVETQGDFERRIQVLEEQVKAIQAEIAALRTSFAPSAPAQPVVPPPGLAAAPTGGDQPTPTQLPVYGGPTASKVFNPDIGIIGNLISASGESRGGSDTVAPTPFITLQESEASFQAIIDPYARADFFLALGEEGIEVEEGFVTFPTLPGGFLVKAGKIRANFGRLNAFHNHTLPWTDRPLVMFNLLGGATGDPDTGIKDAGVSVSRLIPAGNLFVEATGEIFRGDSGTLFQSSRRQDFSLVSRLRAYSDIAESSNIEVGGSYARGHNEAGSDFLTQLYGVDLTFRWKPLRRALYRSFIARSELIWSRRQDPVLGHDAFGLYGSADYQLGRRWFVGGRLDWSERAREASIRDRGVSAVLTFWPSEFNQVRGQYRRTRFGDDSRVANELLFQLLFTIGAHGAHAF